MNWRHAAVVPGLSALLGAPGADPARAADRPCPPMAVETDAQVRARWPGLPGRIREAFDARADIDRCARVTLTMSHAAIVVRVVLLDGRSASRAVSRRDDVVPTLSALLLVPRDDQPPPEGSPEPGPGRSAEREVAASARLPSRERASAARLPAPEPGRLGIELSVAAGARIGDGQASVGLGALSFVDVAGWLFGFAGRVDVYRGLGGGQPGGALELAVLGGRRFRSGTLALDLTVGPALALRGPPTSATQAGTSDPIAESAGGNVPRLLLGARLGFGARSVVRTFAGIEADLGPAGAATEPPGAGGRLPVWTAGLVLGAGVGSP
jgi:hypothetical protein